MRIVRRLTGARRLARRRTPERSGSAHQRTSDHGRPIHQPTPDHGGSTLELAILWPVILLLVFGAVQVAAYFTARTVALSAAQVAVSTERQYHATGGSGVVRAEAFLAGTGDWLGNAQVGQPVHTADAVEVTVTGTALSIVPGVTWGISQTARGTIEQFTGMEATAPGAAP